MLAWSSKPSKWAARNARRGTRKTERQLQNRRKSIMDSIIEYALTKLATAPLPVLEEVDRIVAEECVARAIPASGAEELLLACGWKRSRGLLVPGPEVRTAGVRLKLSLLLGREAPQDEQPAALQDESSEDPRSSASSADVYEKFSIFFGLDGDVDTTESTTSAGTDGDGDGDDGWYGMSEGESALAIRSCIMPGSVNVVIEVITHPLDCQGQRQALAHFMLRHFVKAASSPKASRAHQFAGNLVGAFQDGLPALMGKVGILELPAVSGSDKPALNATEASPTRTTKKRTSSPWSAKRRMKPKLDAVSKFGYEEDDVLDWAMASSERRLQLLKKRTNGSLAEVSDAMNAAAKTLEQTVKA
eukprot:TRINITY_DN16027_c0_g1_i1.p1 TRINITY_DN16027_c0_g1~~TRINITY_DN16027_c0_g1_i1.p1  ORF type:complete len:360 (+),score=92.38 TRINITY_DN16027_c0_g1_i1:57-1136(+)